MTRAILVNTEHDYVSYGHQRNTADNFETEPHATIKCLVKAKGTEAEGGILYLLQYPCFECAKAIVYAGIKKVVYKYENPADPTCSETQLFFKHSDIEVVKNPDIDF